MPTEEQLEEFAAAMRGKRVFLSGPMSGLPEHNHPKFHSMANLLRAQGLAVWNPAELDGGDTSRPWSHYMRQDVAALTECDVVLLLPGWEGSRGSNLEVLIADALGLPIYLADTLRPAFISGCSEDITEALLPFFRRAPEQTAIDMAPPAKSILEEASRITAKDRRDAYGHPLDNFARTGAYWSVKLGIPITAEDVAEMMILLKQARNDHKRDRENYLDIAGYAWCGQEVIEERVRRAT